MEDMLPPLWVFITFRLAVDPHSSIGRVWDALDRSVGRGTVQRIREGHTKLGADTLHALAKKLSCSAADVQQILDGQSPHPATGLAHGLSYTADTVPHIEWEELMQTKDLPPEFWIKLVDDAMAPRAPKGTGLRFRRSTSRDFEKDGQFGQVVLLLAPDGKPHVRLLGQDVSHRYQLRPTNANYASFVGSMIGLELLGVMTAIEDTGSLFA